MLNKLLITLLTISCSFSLMAQSSPWGTFAPETPTSKFKIFDGFAQIGGNALEIGDYIGAFDESGILVGLTEIDDLVAGQAVFALDIYEDDPGGRNIGMNLGDMFTIQYYDTSTDLYYTLDTYGPWTAVTMNGVKSDGDMELEDAGSGHLYNTDDTPDERILSINLISFTGKPYQGNIYLEWITSSEENNAYYTLEKSKNGHDFKAIATVKAIGTSSQTNRYEWLDNDPFTGNNYYRLKTTDLNGKEEVHATILVDYQILRATDLQIYPNPTSNEFTIESGVGVAEVRLVDMTGKEVLKRISASDVTTINISVANLPAGIYNVQVLSQNKVLNSLLKIK